MAEQLKIIVRSTVARYELLTPPVSTKPSLKGAARQAPSENGAFSLNRKHQAALAFAPSPGKRNKARLNHMQFWPCLNKIVVHSTSKKLLHQHELYANFNFALTCLSGQTPSYVKSKMSVAAFKMMRGSVLGSACALRRSVLLNFCYKWSFLAAASKFDSKSKASSGLGIDNVFIFELDLLDYDAFEPLPGLELSFDIKPQT